MVAGALLILSGCVSATGETDEPKAGVNRPADEEPADEPEEEPVEEEPAEEPVEEEPAEEAPADDGIAKFGESYEWEDGITVTIGKVAKFEPSEWAAGGDTYEHAIAFFVTIVNGGDEKFDPALANGTMQSANTEADSIFDSENGVGGSPSTSILPGREVKYKVAYSVSDPKDLVFEFAPSWDHESVIWTSTGS